jgi:hypothetical protein
MSDNELGLQHLVPPRRLGRMLRALREVRGDTIEMVTVRALGQITADRLEALEAGEDFADPAELDLLADLYAFEITDLAPSRTRLVLDFSERVVAGAGFAAVVPEGETAQGVLRRYLTLVWVLRGRPQGSDLSLRDLDVDVLADGLGIGRSGVVGVLNDLIGDPSWVSQRGHPSSLSTILPLKIAPGAGILLSSGPEGALVFEADGVVEQPND